MMTVPADLEVRSPGAADVAGIAELVGACDATYRSWAPPGWEPPPAGRELDRWRGRVTDGSWWTRIAVEPAGRVVGLVCFTQAVTGAPPWVDPIPGRAHVSAMFTHPGRWREGVASGLLGEAERAMREAGYVEAQLWTPEEAPARDFYESQGWLHDGRRQWLDDLSLPIVAYVKSL
jgi:GNAT superfamily N-acetyltransferase